MKVLRNKEGRVKSKSRITDKIWKYYIRGKFDDIKDTI
jgi:hypothetical protein